MYNFFIFRTHVVKFAFQALLMFLHSIYNFYLWIVDQTIFRQPDPCRNRSVDSYKKYSLVKRPNHLVVSVCQEKIFYEYLAKLLAWALFLEVPIISFYHNEDGNISIIFL